MSYLYLLLLLSLIYAYCGYGVLLYIVSLFVKEKTKITSPKGYHVVLLVVCHNEELNIEKRITNALSQDLGDNRLDVVIVSDGSTDRTVELAQKYQGSTGIQLLAFTDHQGKVTALNRAVESISCDILVFSDANTIFRKNTIFKMLRHFADSGIGGVCGQLKVPSKKRGWIARFEALYWAYDNKIKLAESRLGSTVSAQGSVYAIRRELYCPLPPGVADDFFQSAQLIRHGKRLLFDPEAISEEYVSERLVDEFGRRVRSTQQGWRALMVLSELLNPWRYGLYAIQLFSHKFLKRLTPFLLVCFLLVNVVLQGTGVFYCVSLWLQVAFYGLALVAWLFPWVRRLPGGGFSLFFVSGHLAMGLGVLKAVLGVKSQRWKPVRDRETL